jgi:hypothetical protein
MSSEQDIFLDDGNSELYRYLESSEELFKNVCFIRLHKYLYLDIKKNIKLLSKEITIDNRMLLKYILNIQFNLLKLPEDLELELKLDVTRYNILNLLTIILSLLQIDTKSIYIIYLFEDKLTEPYTDNILKTLIYNYISIFNDSEEVKLIISENADRFFKEMADIEATKLERYYYNLENGLQKIDLNIIDSPDLIPLAKEYNLIIDKCKQNINSQLINYYNDHFNKNIFIDNLVILSESDKEFITKKVDLYMKSISIDNLYKLTNHLPKESISFMFYLDENLEDKKIYDSIKISLNKDGILRKLLIEKDELKFNSLDWLKLRDIKNRFINQFINLLFETIENPKIISGFRKIKTQIDKVVADINIDTLMNDINDFKEIITPILQKIENPIFYIIQEIEKNRDISINGYILFIKYILNELIIQVNTFFYQQSIEKLSKKINDIIESSLMYQFITGKFDYTKLFKIKNINIDYLFEIIKDCISKLILVKLIIEAEKATENAARSENHRRILELLQRKMAEKKAKEQALAAKPKE